MLVDSNDVFLVGLVLLLVGFSAGRLWCHCCNKPARDSRGRFMKR